MSSDTHFSGLVQAFFTDRLLRQRGASPNTVAGNGTPSACSCDSLTSDWGRLRRSCPSRIWTRFSSATSLITWRKSAATASRSRNTRLAAIHSFFHYLWFQEPPTRASAAVSWPSPASATSGG